MPNKVTIIDDTSRRNVMQEVTPYIQQTFLLRGLMLPEIGTLLPMKIKGQQVQEPVSVPHVFEGQHLQNVIRRAKHWMRSKKFMGNKPPHHIALAMAAFSKAQPVEFHNILSEVGAAP